MVVGVLSLVLGVLGIFLPVLPTTPFVLLAAACFARASERWYRWLTENRYCGPAIRDWRRTRSIPLRSKLIAITMIVVSLGTSITFFVPIREVKILLAVIGLAVIGYIARIPLRKPGE